MISRVIEMNQFAQIRLILEADFGDDLFSDWFSAFSTRK